MRKKYKNKIFNLLNSTELDVNKFELIEDEQSTEINYKDFDFKFWINNPESSFDEFDFKYTQFVPGFKITGLYPERGYTNFEK